MKANIIDNWLKENTNPKIDKQVENEYKEIMSKEAKDKAEELIEKMSFETARVCALICVNEIINTYIEIDPKLFFWKQVKQEILKRQ